MSQSYEYGLYRSLSDRGVVMPTRVSATDLRRDLRELLARVEYDRRRVEICRQGRPVAALLPLEALRHLEGFERTGIRYHREHLTAVAELRRLRARFGE